MVETGAQVVLATPLLIVAWSLITLAVLEYSDRMTLNGSGGLKGVVTPSQSGCLPDDGADYRLGLVGRQVTPGGREHVGNLHLADADALGYLLVGPVGVDPENLLGLQERLGLAACHLADQVRQNPDEQPGAEQHVIRPGGARPYPGEDGGHEEAQGRNQEQESIYTVHGE